MKIEKDGKYTFVAQSSDEGKKELAKRKAEAVKKQKK